MKAVRFDEYGGVDVLKVVDVDRPAPGPGQVLVRVLAAGINPGEAAIRTGTLARLLPATFPSGQGSDLAGIAEEVGEDAGGWSVGDEVLGWTDRRASHAEFVVVDADHLVRRPDSVPWEVAGSLFVVGTTAYAAVEAVSLKAGETVVVSAAAGGVGSLVVQLARLAEAKVIGLAGEANHAWLDEHGVVPVLYGEGEADRIRTAAGGPVDAFVDTFGAEYVELAIHLGVPPERINTIANWSAAATYGTKTEGNAAGARAEVLEELVAMIGDRRLELPVARVYPLTDVREAYRDLEQRHTHGKIVLRP